MIFDKQQHQWIDQALAAVYSGTMTDLQVAKTLRIIGQIFERKARDIEFDLVDRVENRLYNTNTETKERNYA